MRTAELGIVIMVVVVGASPDAAGAEREDSKNSHQTLGQARAGQDRLVLLIVINHKKTEDEQAGENTANDAGDGMEIPERPREGRGQKKTG